MNFKLCLLLSAATFAWTLSAKAAQPGAVSMGPPSASKTVPAESATSMKVCSFNIRFANNKGDKFPDGSSAAWADRRDAVKKFIDTVRPELIGLQEIRKAQSQDFQAFFGDDYGYYDVGRDSESGASVAEADCEGVGLLYLKERFELVKKGFFWLDAAPQTRPVRNEDHTCGQWHSACRRITTYAVLKDKAHGGSLLYFFSTHFDHKSKEAILNSSSLMVEKMKELSGVDDLKKAKAVIIMVGDLNTKLEAGLMEPLMQNLYYARTEIGGEDLNTGTFNGFGKADSLIDHIFYGGKSVIPLKYWVDKTDYGVPFISDHFPVFFSLDYK